MNPRRAQRVFTVLFGLLLFLTLLGSSLHFHSDGQYHEDCLLCQYSGFLHSMQAESTFILSIHYDSIVPIGPYDLQVPFTVSIQADCIRPPPRLG